uniref:HTH psq-type domain-containing protein n=1 Tax=Dracunculus medinensis TaxID=318479 RepID=A0A0N4U169_DRAME
LGKNGEKASQKGRKLKQYVLKEKLDIIDYAKVIGNRAAGREFSVAESSIREWRKNEHRLRLFPYISPPTIILHIFIHCDIFP